MSASLVVQSRSTRVRGPVQRCNGAGRLPGGARSSCDCVLLTSWGRWPHCRGWGR